MYASVFLWLLVEYLGLFQDKLRCRTKYETDIQIIIYKLVPDLEFSSNCNILEYSPNSAAIEIFWSTV
jgi:hypothetical protein